MSTRPRAPAVFIGHGSPMNALEDNAFSRSWRALGARIGRPASILCVSAHWETPGTTIAVTPRPRTIHDFGNFPRALFEVRYPAPGAPALADRVERLLEGVAPVARDSDWGLDHGAWSVLRLLYPEADVPVAQMSLDPAAPGATHLALGRALAPLRDEGVMILGTGNLIHNLRVLDWRPDATGYEWAVKLDAHMKALLVAGDFPALCDYRALDPQRLGIPTPEHFLPALYVLGAAAANEPPQIFNDVCVMGSLSMTSVGFGLPA